MTREKFCLIKRFKSFGYAFNGLKTLIAEEHNARIHLFAAVCTVIAGFVFKISVTEWIAVIFAIGLVFSLEIINSAIENFSDFISPERHDTIKKIKDMSAASVLISSITAFVIGIIIFVPRIVELF